MSIEEPHEIYPTSSQEDKIIFLPGNKDSSPLSTERSYNLSFILQISLIVAMGGFIFGYDTGIIGGAALYFELDFPPITSSEKETIVSLAIIGAASGCLIMGPISDNFGRKISMIIGDFIFMLGAFLMYRAKDIPMLMAGRFVAGLGIGCTSVVVPIYLVETSFTAIRGFIVSFYQILIATGQFSAYLVVLLCGDNWRLMLGLSALPAVIQLLLLLCFPESPKWLMKMNRQQEAEAIWSRIFNVKTEKGKEEMKNEIKIMKEELELEDSDGSQLSKYRELFTVYKKIVFIGVMLQIFQQFTGINTVMYYVPTILEKAGFGGKNSHEFTLHISLVLAGCLTLGCYISTIFIDKFGRRFLMLRSLPGMSLCMCLVGVAMWFVNDYSRYSTWLLVIALFIYLALYSIGMGATPNIVNSEIYPIHLRGIGNSIATMGTWLSNYLISAVFLTAIETKIGECVTYGIFAFSCAAAFVFIYILLPETKGKNIEENIKAIIPNLEISVKKFRDQVD